MINNEIHQLAYNLNVELLNTINQRNFNTLESDYGISAELFDEIEEIITDVGVDLNKVSLSIQNDKILDIWEFDQEDGYGIEVALSTSNGETTDLTLTTKLEKVDSNYKLQYRQIEVM